MASRPDLPGVWQLSCDMVPAGPSLDVALAAILTWRRVWGAASPNVTFGTNKKLSIKTAAARNWALPLAPGCYPDPNSGVLS